MLETPVRQQCFGFNHYFLTSKPRKYSRKTLKIWERRERKKLLGEGKTKSQANKIIEVFKEEEKKTWRCELCQKVVEDRRRKEKKEKEEKKKIEKERIEKEEFRIVKIEEGLNYIREKLEKDKTLTDKVEIINQINEIRQALQPTKLREGQKKEEWKELWDLKKNYTKKNWDIPLTKKQEDKIWGVKSIDGLRRIVEDIEKIHGEIQYLKEHSIYSLKTWKHQVGWPVFLVSVAVAIKKIRKIIKKKSKQAANIQEEVQEKFNLWRLNMLLSVAGYAVSFFILKGAIDKWLRPNIAWCLENWENTTILSVTGILGGLFLLDSYISSELKTPLQRLAIKIESANISEKEKKELLSITQRSNETFKETLKRFGLLTIAGTLIKLLGKAFDEKFIANFCYVIPIAFGGWQIWEVSKKIKRSKWEEKN